MRALRFLSPMIGKAELASLLIVGALAVAATGIPVRTLDEASNRSLAAALNNAPPPTGAIVVTQPIFLSRTAGVGSHGVDSADGLREAIDHATSDVIDEVQPFMGSPLIHAESVRFRAIEVNGVDPALPTLVTLRFQEGLVSAADVAEGRLPVADAAAIEGVPVIEVVMSRRSMERALLSLGDMVLLQRDGSDPAAIFVLSGTSQVLVHLVGVVDLPPQDDPVWAGDDSPVAGRVVDTPVGADVYLTGFVTESQLVAMSHIVPTTGMKAVAVFPLDPARVRIGDAGRLEEALRRLDAATRDTPSIGGDPSFRSGLPFVLGLEREKRAAVVAVLEVLRAGMLTLVAAVAFSVARAFSDQRRARSALNRGRGAVALDLLVASVLVVAPVSLVGAVGAEWALDAGWPTTAGWAEPVGVMLVVIAGYLWAAWRPTAAPLPVLLGTARDGWSRYRVAGLVALPVCAGAAILSGRAQGRLGTVAPFLVAIAASVLLERLLRSTIRVPGNALGIGSKMAARRGRGRGFVLSLAVGITVVAVSMSVVVTLRRAIDVAAWNEVLAPVRVELPIGGLPDDLARLPGVLVAETDVRIQGPAGTGVVSMLLVDPRALTAVTAGTPAAITLPETLLVDPGDRLPVVVASGFGRRPALPSDDLSIVIGGVAHSAFAAGTLDRFPSVPAGGLFAIANRDQFEALVGPAPPPSVMLLSSADEAVIGRLVAAGATVTVRSEVARRLTDDPLVQGVLATMRLTAVMAGVLTIGGVLAGLLAELAEARAVNAILTAVGARRRQRRLAASASVLPGVLSGVLGGSLAWWATVRWLGDLVDFGPFALTAERLGFDLAGLAVPAVAGLVATLSIVWLSSGLLDRRSVATVLRTEGAT